MSSEQNILNKLQIYSYEIAAAAIIVLATGLRVALGLLGWTATDGDEAIMSLAALHIMKGQDYPIFFYGQHYLGVLEAYVGALVFRIFGASILAMHLEMVAFSGGFFVCLFILTRKLYTKAFALLILVIFLFGSVWTMAHQIQATGYPELPLLTALIFLIAYTLAASHTQLSMRKRIALYLLWGWLVGLALWVDLIVAPYVLVAGMIILVFCWREVVRWAIWLLLFGLIVGTAPLIYYNLTPLPGQDSLHIFLSQLGSDAYPSLNFHVIASFFYSLPLSLGYASSVCIPAAWTPALFAGPDRGCAISMGIWSGGYLFLAAIALILVCLAISKLYHSEESGKRQQQMIQQFARLMLLCGFGISFLSYIRGGSVTIDPLNNWRYLICTWISVPAVLWPLWTCEQWFRWLWLRRGVLVLKSCVLLLICFTLASATEAVFQQAVPVAQAKNRDLARLEQTLKQMHMTRFYSGYWTCNPIIAETQEQLICGSTTNNLTHDYDRYHLYRAIVEADPHPGFVYPDNAPQITALKHYLTLYKLKYQHFEVAGYAIYRMYGHIPSLNL